MDAVFIELPAFDRNRTNYFDEESFADLLDTLMANPFAGDVLEGTGGLRKLRFVDPRRGKGKRGGLRIIYYFWTGGPEFWLFAVFDKNEASDLAPRQREVLRESLKRELKARRTS